jgi:hypothetical protein
MKRGKKEEKKRWKKKIKENPMSKTPRYPG